MDKATDETSDEEMRRREIPSGIKTERSSKAEDRAEDQCRIELPGLYWHFECTKWRLTGNIPAHLFM